jgi:transcriptional regulator with XRE-family HTH domain
MTASQPPLRAVRSARGLTLEQLAARTDPPIPVSALSRIERGLTVPTLPTLYRIAVAAGLDELARMLAPWIGGEDV